MIGIVEFNSSPITGEGIRIRATVRHVLYWTEEKVPLVRKANAKWGGSTHRERTHKWETLSQFISINAKVTNVMKESDQGK